MNKAFNPLDFSTAIESPIAVSLDIETSDRVSTSKILSIGATLGNILTGEVLGSFYMRIKLDGQESRSSSQDTIQFWEDQKGSIAYSEAWDQSLDRFSLKETLVQFNRFLELASQHELALDDNVHVIGNGPEFDNQFIIDALESFGIKPSWKFRNNDSHRTIVYMARLLLGLDFKKSIPFKGERHHALDDSRHEWDYAVASINAFLTMLKQNTPQA